MSTRQEMKIEVAKTLFTSWAGNTDNHEPFSTLAERAFRAAEAFASEAGITDTAEVSQ